MSRIRELNNAVAQLIAKGDWEQAEALLALTRKLIEGRAAGASDLEGNFDEYFYRCHRVHVSWSRGAAAIDDAWRAAELEDAIDGAALAMGKRREFAYSQGAWSLVSVLTRVGQLDKAEAAIAAIVADGERFAARLHYNAASAEQVLVAGLCIFFERELVRARPLVERIAALVREPRNKELLYGLACFHARMGERAEALAWLEQSIARGYDRVHASGDSDLKILHGDPRFEQAIAPPRGPAPPEWSIDSHPPGALITVDGVSTEKRTPARLPVRPKGVYQLRLTLDGHRDLEYQHHQSSDDCGWSSSFALESLAAIAEKARMAEDSRRTPDEAAQKATRVFLGELEAASIEVVRHTTYGLGETRITVDGRGHVSLHHRPFAPKESERAHTLTLAADETRGLFEAFIAQAFTEIVIAPHSGVPDELHFTVTLTAGGRTCSLGKFVQTEHRRFDALAARVGQTVAAHLDAKTRKHLAI